MVTFDSRTVSRGAGTLDVSADGGGETVEYLIARAEAAGFKVTKRQIERWNYKKLLPDPIQNSLGRYGSLTIYPVSTGNQLIALCQIKTDHPKLEEVAWYLWLSGFSISERLWRPTIDRAADWWDKTTFMIEKFFYQNEHSELSDEALDLLEENKDKRSKDQIFNQIKLRINGSRNVPSLVRIAFDMLFGRLEYTSFDDLEEGETFKSPKGDRKIFIHAMGFKQAWSDRLPGGQPLLSRNIVPSLLELSKILIQNRGKSIKNASIAEVEETRDELCDLLTILSQAGYLLEQAYGKHAFGLGIAQYITKEQRPKQQAILISLWHKIRQSPGYKEGATNIIALKEPLNSVYHKFQELQDKSREIPALRELFTPERLKNSLQSREEGKAFSLELGRILESLSASQIESE